MKPSENFWDSIQLVVFDVDGTLYPQRPLRIRMLGTLLLHALAKRSLETITVIKHFRRIREDLGDQGLQDFEATLFERTAEKTGQSPEKIAKIVHEWIEVRPLAYIANHHYPQLIDVFRALRSRGIKIGVFSDYPATQKLKAMHLEADFVVSAEDPDIRVLKPNPKGLIRLMAKAETLPENTLMIGDRFERDGLAAQNAGAHCLILSHESIPGWRCFKSYDAFPFSILFGSYPPHSPLRNPP